MLHSVPLKCGVQTFTLMQNPIAKAGKMKAKTLDMYSRLNPTFIHDVTPYPQEKCCKIFSPSQTTYTVS